MEPEISKIYRIVVADGKEPAVNMVYAEVGGEDYEIFGAFSGISGGGGLFHQNKNGAIVVSDDPSDFVSKFGFESANKICAELERHRAAFETYDEEGNLTGLSEEGLVFLHTFSQDQEGEIKAAYSQDASDDFIYDIQDEWNLNFCLK